MSKNKYFTSISIGVATVWFSTHCGAGFASGTQELQYFANHGWFGVFMPIVTFAIIAFTYYIGLETARQTDKWGYDLWSKEAFGSASKLLTPAMDFSIIITTIAATAATIATGGLLGNQYLGLPVAVGSIAMFIIVTILCIFGENLVRKNAMIMTSAILVIISIVLVAGLIKFAPDIARLFREGYVNPNSAKWSISGSADTVPGNIGNSLLWGLTYAGFQISAIGGIAASFKGGSFKQEAKGAMIMGAVINILMLVGICLLIFSQMPHIYLDEATRKLPTVFIVNQLNIPVLAVLYPILLFLALITTAVGFIFGMVQRLDPYVLKNMDSKPVLRKAIISFVCLLVCYAVSKLGLMWVVQVAYKYLGIFNWAFIILPLWILGYKNIKKRDKGEKLEA
ncbi:YkvI family membrane protein [Peptostreptococcus anaerobius]|uniref:YkvI family membrane protein n=1 Tax=Peptostreptococcus anaerobius TaxID=1261 RepID=UPI00321B4CC5